MGAHHNEETKQRNAIPAHTGHARPKADRRKQRSDVPLPPLLGAQPRTPTVIARRAVSFDRARVGRDCIRVQRQVAVLVVSIHAPVWGATFADDGKSILVAVSIHAPVWGATRPRAVHVLGVLVSIHAPVWGATLT